MKYMLARYGKTHNYRGQSYAAVHVTPDERSRGLCGKELVGGTVMPAQLLKHGSVYEVCKSCQRRWKKLIRSP